MDMNTPDTEWETANLHKELAYFDFLKDTGMNNNPECDASLYDYLLGVVEGLLSSRDTYWKERVRKEVEAIRKPEREEPNEMADMKKWEVWDRLTDEDEIYNQALDTLLDNLKWVWKNTYHQTIL